MRNDWECKLEEGSSMASPYECISSYGSPTLTGNTWKTLTKALRIGPMKYVADANWPVYLDNLTLFGVLSYEQGKKWWIKTSNQGSEILSKGDKNNLGHRMVRKYRNQEAGSGVLLFLCDTENCPPCIMVSLLYFGVWFEDWSMGCTCGAWSYEESKFMKINIYSLWK